MINTSPFYFDVLYPFQDQVIAAINQVDTGFYLTGGTAASRGYLQHRFSDDAAGVFPADLGRVLCSVQREDWESVRWIQAPPVETFISQLNELGESLLLIK